MNSLPGWPDRTSVMLTSAGTQIFEFRAAEGLDISPGCPVGLGESRWNELIRATEVGGYFGNLAVYHDKGLYPVITEATTRVIKCLQGKGRENFAQ